MTQKEVLAARLQVLDQHLSEPLNEYIVQIVLATRQPDRYGDDLRGVLQYGASPRASINLIEGARALAFMRGRTYVLPQDVTDLVPDVFRHRLVLSYEAIAEGITADRVIHRIMRQLPPPEKPLEARGKKME